MGIDRRGFLVATGLTAGLATARSMLATLSDSETRVIGLKADGLEQPLGLENRRPRFSWQLDSDKRNVQQQGYRIFVASSEAGLRPGAPDLWDSGQRESLQSTGIEYEGAPLQSRMQCQWCVLVWDNTASTVHTSEVSRFEMGLLSPGDWQAAWLAAEDPPARADREAGLHWIWGSTNRDTRPRQFRTRFMLPAPTAAGTVYVSAGTREELLGVWIDGTAMPLTAPRKYAATRPPLQVITLKALGAGSHVIAVEVHPGDDPLANALPSNGAAMTAFARLELVNGDTLRVTAQSGWKTRVDAPANWFLSHYDDTEWEEAQPSRDDLGQPWPAAPATNLRGTFSVNQRPRSARLYVTALGLYEARVNGARVGEALLTPEPSDYRKRVLYRTYDVTAMIEVGDNALGLLVGDGWYAGPVTPAGRYPWGPPLRRALAQLELVLSNGTRQTVVTGPDWRAHPSAILRSEIYDGELCDHRLTEPGWDTAHFGDAHWTSAEVTQPPPCRVVAQVTPPIRVTQVLKPRQIATLGPARYVVDFGQTFAGWCRLRAQGPAGTRIELRFAEGLTPQGAADQSNLRGAAATDTFILRGEQQAEVCEPKFTYHGFRYVEITGLPAAPSAESIEGLVVHSDLNRTGTLRVDNALIQQIWYNTVWTLRSNFVGIPTDCADRDERLGWFVDPGGAWDAAAFSMDVDAYTRRRMDDSRDEQAPNGAFPMLAPSALLEFSASDTPQAGWADVSVVMPWIAWQRYGDTRIIEENWEAMHRFSELVRTNNPHYLWENKAGDSSDWLAVDAPQDGAATTPSLLLATAHWAHSTDLLAQMAVGTARIREADRLHDLLKRIRGAFAQTFITPDGVVANDSQTGYVLALNFNLVPPPQVSAVADRLAENIRRRGVTLTTGIIGTRHILDVLADNGYVDLAYSLLLRRAYPSWGYMIDNGATTMWERWNGDHGDLAMNSFDHIALASVGGFLFRRLAGIDAATPGFETLRIRPAIDGRVDGGGGDFDSVKGRISTNWDHSSRHLRLDVTIPANTQAFIHLPVPATARLREGLHPIGRHRDVRLIAQASAETVLKVGSGRYHFEASF